MAIMAEVEIEKGRNVLLLFFTFLRASLKYNFLFM